MAVHPFFLSPILSWVGPPVLTPMQSMPGGSLIGVPATRAFIRHIRRLMDEVDGS